MIELDYTENFFIINFLGLLLGLAFGAVAQKTQFCFSGSIKDYILTKSTRRAASVIIAMITAIITTQAIGYIYNLDFSTTVFLNPNINYFTIILGGCLFGIGMMIADGCSSRHLIKFAQGDIHSLITLLFIAIFSYIAAKGLLSEPIAFITSIEFLKNINQFIPNNSTNIIIALLPLLLLLRLLAKYHERIPSLWDGIAVGLIISLAWYVTGVIGDDEFNKVTLDSFRFVYPAGKTLEYFMFFNGSTLTFSITIILGIVIGAFIMSKFNKRYSFGCTSNSKGNKLKNSMIGGSLMGTGGIMAIGCTVGQGITGLSTLAFASLVAISSIIISGYFTGKFLAKKDMLPMCFIFEWDDKR